jgi:hypothetical protein
MAAEHVPPHHGSSDVGKRLLDDRGAFIHFATFHVVWSAECREVESPLVQSLTTDAEWILDALIGTSNEPVERHRDLETQLGHV